MTAVANPAADRAPAYGIAAEIIDGNDVLAVRDSVAAAAERARAGGGRRSSRPARTGTTATAGPTRRRTAPRRR